MELLLSKIGGSWTFFLNDNSHAQRTETSRPYGCLRGGRFASKNKEKDLILPINLFASYPVYLLKRPRFWTDTLTA